MSLYATRHLLRKNFLLSVRDTGALSVTLLAPFIVMLILYFDQISINNGSTFVPELLNDPNPSSESLQTIPRCVPRATENCVTIAYTPNNDSRIVGWVTEVARRSSIPSDEVRGFDTETSLNNDFIKNPNVTQGAYIFNDYTQSQVEGGNVSFIVQYNSSNQAEFPLGLSNYDKRVIMPAMVHSMNLVMMSSLSNRNFDVALNTSIFPHPPIVKEGLPPPDAFSENGAFMTFATFFITLIFFLYRLVIEKEKGLRDAMRLAGMTQSQHYISWVIPLFCVNVVVMFILIIFGLIFRFKVFTELQFPLYFLTFFIFALSMIGWTMFLASFINRALSVSTIGFNFFIFGYVIAASVELLYLDSYTGPKSLRKVFAISPITMYIRVMNVLSLASNLPSSPVTMSNISSFPEIFSVRTCWLWMLGSGAVVFVLSLYFDNVLATPHGKPLPALYFLKPSYWFPRQVPEDLFSMLEQEEEAIASSPDKVEPISNAPVETRSSKYDPNVEDEDVRREREAITGGECDDAALVIQNVSKKFKKNLAVDDVSLSVGRNTAFALLGANGAGKSTIFKMATTTLSPTAGDVKVYGLSVREDRNAVRQLIGVCPQFDIFWDKLTGAEHITLFAALRGYTPSECEEEVRIRLDDVSLLADKKSNVYAGSYSGGMQRRLSVAIALTGNPRVVFLDECTSGSDPLVRRDLWASIQRAKKGRVVFLITHSMAEAEYIAGRDRIGIMAKGKLRVLGDGLHLKTKFGAGICLVVVIAGDQSQVNEVVKAMQNVLNATVTLTSVANAEEEGEVVANLALPSGIPDMKIVEAVQLLETQREQLCVKDFSINSTTLGEVFKSITSLSEDQVEQGDDLIQETFETQPGSSLPGDISPS